MRRGNVSNLRKDLWPDVDDQMLAYMWVDLGKSMSEIGRVLKRSRNSVAGRIARLKITRAALAKKKDKA